VRYAHISMHGMHACYVRLHGGLNLWVSVERRGRGGVGISIRLPPLLYSTLL